MAVVDGHDARIAGEWRDDATLAAALAGATDFREWLATDERVAMHSVHVDPVTQTEAVDWIFSALDRGRGGTVVTPNLEILRQADRDPELRALIAGSDLVLADGTPLIWASRIARTALPERVTGADLVFPLCERAALDGRSVFMLGGSDGTADAAAAKLTAQIPTLAIAGTCCPPMGFESCEDERERIRTQLLETQPDIVLVALGAPKQERLIAELRPLLPNTWFLGVGMALGFIAGEQRRAPKVLQKTGLEWTHRLASEPGRLGRRYLRDGLPFAGRLGVWALRQRFAATA